MPPSQIAARPTSLGLPMPLDDENVAGRELGHGAGRQATAAPISFRASAALIGWPKAAP